MRKLITLLVLILLMIAGAWLLRNPAQTPSQVRNLPWQIEVLPDGTSRVFGLLLGRATLNDAREQLGDDMELAVIALPGEDPGALEMFYSHYTAGLFTGKLIITADLPAQQLSRMRERALKSDYTRSTARKFTLHPDDVALAWQAGIKAITFLPTVDIDEATAGKRFGTPAQIVSHEPGASHWLYPDKGLDLVLNDSGRDVLQYVAPREFASLSAPLQDATPGKGSENPSP